MREPQVRYERLRIEERLTDLGASNGAIVLLSIFARTPALLGEVQLFASDSLSELLHFDSWVSINHLARSSR